MQFSVCASPHIHLFLSFLHFGFAVGAFIMASFEIATKANVASVLPGLLVALNLQQEQTSLLPSVSESFHDCPTLPSKEAIQMTCSDGKTWSGKAIVRYLAELATSSNTNTSPQHAASVCFQSRGHRLLANNS
jgi:hypothetical protein